MGHMYHISVCTAGQLAIIMRMLHCIVAVAVAVAVAAAAGLLLLLPDLSAILKVIKIARKSLTSGTNTRWLAGLLTKTQPTPPHPNPHPHTTFVFLANS